MQKECDALKTKVLDQTNKEIILEIKHSQNELEELKKLLQTSKCKICIKHLCKKNPLLA